MMLQQDNEEVEQISARIKEIGEEINQLGQSGTLPNAEHLHDLSAELRMLSARLEELRLDKG